MVSTWNVLVMASYIALKKKKKKQIVKLLARGPLGAREPPQ